MIHVLVVDDDADSADSLCALIAGPEVSVATAKSLEQTRRQIALQQPDIILLDLMLPDGNGMDLFSDSALLARSEVVLITGHATLETSIQALRLGAADYLVKPATPVQLKGVLSRFMKPAALQAEVADLNAQLARRGNFGHLWGRTPPMLWVYEQIARVAGTSVSVLVYGESGTGKELVAQTLHELSRRRRQPFLAVNCGAISPHLFESEIFGHEKGSFTGAERQHIGFFERANGGTLFLDEITEMPLALQVKLLRVLETGRFSRVGSTASVDADVRVIAASNRPLQQAVDEGRLREDLLYRLNAFPIELPPLRRRLDDLALLADHFLAGMCKSEGLQKRFSPEAMQQLRRHDWPGNVRELRNAVQRAFVMAPGEVIDARWLPRARMDDDNLHPDDAPPGRAAERPVPDGPFLNGARPTGNGTGTGSGNGNGSEEVTISVTIGSAMADVERDVILATLRHYNHHKERVAAVLGISLKTLYNRLKEYAAQDAARAHGPHD